MDNNMNVSMNHPNSLSAEDIFAGLFLIIFSLVGIVLYLAVFVAMKKLAKKTVGFRFLLSQAIADIHIMLQFGMLPGIIILLQKSFIPTSLAWWLHLYMDGVWWVMCYHFILIAWSRLAAVWKPLYFRLLKPKFCYSLCLAMWLAGFLQSIITHQFAWFAIFWFDPQSYGMTTDWVKYSSGGTRVYYLISNGFFMIAPVPLYACACGVLLRQRRGTAGHNSAVAPTRPNGTEHVHQPQQQPRSSGERQIRAEKRLLIPCAINSLLFAFGQIVINLGVGEGKWIGWSVVVVFSANPFVNSLLFLAFSSVVRKQLFSFLRKPHGSIFAPSSDNVLLVARSRVSSVLPHGNGTIVNVQ